MLKKRNTIRFDRTEFVGNAIYSMLAELSLRRKPLMKKGLKKRLVLAVAGAVGLATGIAEEAGSEMTAGVVSFVGVGG